MPDVRVAAAEALAHLGDRDAAIEALAAVLRNGNSYEVLAAQNALDFLRESGLVSTAEVRALVAGRKFAEPADRIPRYWSELND